MYIWIFPHKSPEFLKQHFPTIYARCLELGIDITRQPMPVVPAAHYTCGGIVTDRDGKTDLNNLYAIGETAHTGLHGANRLASNSLLECLVFGLAAAKDILSQTPIPFVSLPIWDESRVTDADEEIVISHNWDELRRFMWSYVGIVRTNKRLQRAQHRINLLHEEINEYYTNFRVSSDLLELRNLVTTADLIVQSAMLRHESRGLHYSRDYPNTLPQTHNTILQRIEGKSPNNIPASYSTNDVKSTLYCLLLLDITCPRHALQVSTPPAIMKTTAADYRSVKIITNAE